MAVSDHPYRVNKDNSDFTVEGDALNFSLQQCKKTEIPVNTLVYSLTEEES